MVQAHDSVSRARPLLGTFVEIRVCGADRPVLEAAVEDAFGAVARVHRLMSFQEEGSDVSILNREGATRDIEVDAWTYEVLNAGLDLGRRSAGLFDIAVAPALQKLGILPGVPRATVATSSGKRRAASWEAIELLPSHRVRYRSPAVVIDLGGIAKGFAVDRAVDALRARGVASGTVNAGGDLAAFGPEPQRVHIRDPLDPRRLLAAVEVTNEALATTGASFDPFRSMRLKGSAIIDPKTMEAKRGVAGATVRAPSCMVADALTKLVMLAGQSIGRLLSDCAAEALMVMDDGAILGTGRWACHHAA